MAQGFTLAEVLITLGIIGVVAALTLPTLITRQKEKEIAVKLKKFNSIINQSYQLAIKEYGEPENWGVGSAGAGNYATDEEKKQSQINGDEILFRVTKNLKVLSRCPSTDSTCSENTKYTRHSLEGTEYSSFVPRVVLADGTTITGVTWIQPKCTLKIGTSKVLQNVCGEIFVDTNGPKAPNATGKDVFLFYITKYGIIPEGSQNEQMTNHAGHTFDEYCNLEKVNILNGYGCAAWVIENENMDYLHCNDLSWNGKRKCK